jgi:integrase
MAAALLTNSEDKPWTSDGFRASWGKACKRAGIVGVTFHDLRGTAVTRLAIAGCTEAEIATITGHSLRSVRAILNIHYLARDPALGESAIRKLERRTQSPNCSPMFWLEIDRSAGKILVGALGLEPRTR